MIIATSEEYLLAQFTLRMQEVLRLHGICTEKLHPELLKVLWKNTRDRKKIIAIKRLGPHVVDIIEL